MDKMSNSELELAISFSEMMKLDLDEGASILASYDWDIEVIPFILRGLLVQSTLMHKLTDP
jgi:hypothetical protein